MNSTTESRMENKNGKHAKEGMSLTDYNIYIMANKEKLFYIIVAAVVIYAAGFVFYRNHFLSILICPLALLYPRMKTRDIVAKRKDELNVQFKDMLYSLSSSMSAGKPIELAFRDVLEDLFILYPDRSVSIIREVEYINRRIGMNETVEYALADFARRAHIEDVDNFVDVVYTCKRTGGNIVEVIKNTSNIINDKVEIKQEINMLLTERRLEQKVLNILPILMIILLSLSAGDYIKPVFTTAAGRVVMSISLVLITAAYMISKKIMNINV